MAKRVRRVEHELGWGWIARNKDGSEVVPNFRWSSRSVAWDVAREKERLNPPVPKPVQPAPPGR